MMSEWGSSENHLLRDTGREINAIVNDITNHHLKT